MPLSPMRVWEAISEAKGASPEGGARMIPAEFDYVAPESLEDAIEALHDGGEDAKLLAGGHSLIPLMKLRLATPSLLVDLRKVPGLHGVERENGQLADRRADLARRRSSTRPSWACVSVAAATIADPQVRNRGHDRRLAGPRRPGVRPPGGAADHRGRGHPARDPTASGRSPPPTCSGLPRDRRRATARC